MKKVLITVLALGFLNVCAATVEITGLNIQTDTAKVVTGVQSNTLATALQPAATNGLVTASITNGFVTASITNGLTITEEDILAEYLEQYGTTDITVTPTNAFTFDGAGAITAYSGSYTNIVIPYEINGIAVTAFGDSVFQYNVHAISITGSKNLTTIGNAFASDCQNLTSISLPSVTVIGTLFGGRDFITGNLNLTRVEFSSDAPTLGSNPYGSSPNVINYILDASAEGWTNFFGGRPVVFPSHTLETLEVNGTATGIAGVETNEFVIKLQMDAADALSPSYDGVTNIVALSDADPYLIVAADGTATVDRTKGYLQRIAMDTWLVLDVGVSSAAKDSQVSLTIDAGTNTLTYSVNATNTCYGLSDLSVTNTTMFELVSPYGQTEWQAFELETEFK